MRDRRSTAARPAAALARCSRPRTNVSPAAVCGCCSSATTSSTPSCPATSGASSPRLRRGGRPRHAADLRRRLLQPPAGHRRRGPTARASHGRGRPRRRTGRPARSTPRWPGAPPTACGCTSSTGDVPPQGRAGGRWPACWAPVRRLRTSSPRAAATRRRSTAARTLGRELRGARRRGGGRVRHRRHPGRPGRRARPGPRALGVGAARRFPRRRGLRLQQEAFGGRRGGWRVEDRFHGGGYARPARSWPPPCDFAARHRGALEARRSPRRRGQGAARGVRLARKAPSPAGSRVAVVVTG